MEQLLRMLCVVCICVVYNTPMCAHDERLLDGFVLYRDEIEKMRNGCLLAEWERELKRCKNGLECERRERYMYGLAHYAAIEQQLFWHHYCPTTGLYVQERLYPYLPHMFSLWQLAPRRGRGASVALLDTGVAAFSIADDMQYQPKHASISYPYRSPLNYAIVDSEGRLNPLYHLVDMVRPYCKRIYTDAQIEQKLSELVVSYFESQNEKTVRAVCAQLLDSAYVDVDGTFSAQAEAIVHQLMFGVYGIVPGHGQQKATFNIGVLKEPYHQQTVLLNNLPLVRNMPRSLFAAGHGTHTFGQIASIAPDADIIMIKTFDDEGNTRKSYVVRALKKAVDLHIPIVNLSLKVADALDLADEVTHHLEQLLGMIPYVVCSSGNDGDAAQQAYKGEVLSYPARFKKNFWSVGSFGYAHNGYPASAFSQYEAVRGPLFLAPGENILSTGLSGRQLDDAAYVYMTGTSMATALISAFLALAVGEFGAEFAPEQILYVSKKSGFFLHAEKEWTKRSLCGALDMRTALFILHCMRALRRAYSKDVQDNFTQCVDVLATLLCQQAEVYGARALYGVPFKRALGDYIHAAKNHTQGYRVENFFPRSISDTLESAVEYTITQLAPLLRIK